MAVTDDELREADSRLYRWTVRTLYVVAVGLNVYLLVRASADDTEVAIAKARAAAWWREVTKPWREAERFRRAANRVQYEAAQIVEEASDAR